MMALSVMLWRENLAVENSLLDGDANCISEMPVQTNPCGNGAAVQLCLPFLICAILVWFALFRGLYSALSWSYTLHL